MGLSLSARRGPAHRGGGGPDPETILARPWCRPREYRGGVLRRLLPWAGVVAIVVAALVTAGWHNEPASRPPTAPPSHAAKQLSASEAKRVVRDAVLRLG